MVVRFKPLNIPVPKMVTLLILIGRRAKTMDIIISLVELAIIVVTATICVLDIYYGIKKLLNKFN